MKKLLLLASTTFLSLSAYCQWTGTNPLSTTSSVGIGTPTPLAKLHVHGNNSFNNYSPILMVSAANGQNGYGNLMEATNYTLINGVWTPSKDFWITPTGLVSVAKSMRIGTTAANGAYANYKLSVDGDMIAKRCVIQVDSWADYVFADNYDLPTLEEVETFVNENKHLPGVPSECEIRESGIEVGEMNKILMQKVEELTLYVIKLQKKVEALETKN